MRLLVIGATGGTGQQVVAQALQQGHDVTALVRDPLRLTVKHERLRVVTGDVTQGVQPIADAVRGRDVVISALGVGASLKSLSVVTRAMETIVPAMEREGVRRLIFTSAYGVGATHIDVPLIPRILIRLLLRDVYADKEGGEEVLRKSRLDWTLVYPVTLTNGPRTGQYRVGERLALRGLPTISRADLAGFLLAQAGDRTYLKKGVLISH
jgi:putative NADH-flavin reductase